MQDPKKFGETTAVFLKTNTQRCAPCCKNQPSPRQTSNGPDPNGVNQVPALLPGFQFPQDSRGDVSADQRDRCYSISIINGVQTHTDPHTHQTHTEQDVFVFNPEDSLPLPPLTGSHQVMAFKKHFPCLLITRAETELTNIVGQPNIIARSMLYIY